MCSYVAESVRAQEKQDCKFLLSSNRDPAVILKFAPQNVHDELYRVRKNLCGKSQRYCHNKVCRSQNFHCGKPDTTKQKVVQ